MELSLASFWLVIRWLATFLPVDLCFLHNCITNIRRNREILPPAQTNRWFMLVWSFGLGCCGMKRVVFPVDCNASNSSLLLSFFGVNNVPLKKINVCMRRYRVKCKQNEKKNSNCNHDGIFNTIFLTTWHFYSIST